MDVDSIPPGADWQKVLKSWVGECDILLALIGPGWIDARDPETKERRLDNPNDFVRTEIAEALARSIPVVPVLLDDSLMPKADLLPDDLKELVGRQAEYVGYRTFDSDVERLIRKLKLSHSQSSGREARDTIKPKVNNVSTGPLTLGAILKGSPPGTLIDAYPTGKSGVHFVFDLFNGTAFEFSVSKVVVEVFAYENLALGELIHGVGATDVMRCYRAKINPELGRYSANYLKGRPAEYVKILAETVDKFDVEITTTTEGLYSLRVYVSGGAGGEEFDLLVNERQIAFFDRNAGYLIDRGHGQGQKMLSFSEYVEDVEIEGY